MIETTIPLRELSRLKRELKEAKRLAGQNASMWATADNARKAAIARAEAAEYEVREWRHRFDALLAREAKP